MINRTNKLHIQPVKACQPEYISQTKARLQSLAQGQRASVSGTYTSRKTYNDSMSPHVENQQPSSSADYEGGNSALDAAWEQAVLKPLPSTPSFVGDAGEQMSVCDQKTCSLNPQQDSPTLGQTSFCTPGSALEDSEGWESEDSDGSALSSIASFDLDRALEELELDQRAASRGDATSSAESKMSTPYYSPAATLQDSPEILHDHMSSGLAGHLSAPRKGNAAFVYFCVLIM